MAYSVILDLGTRFDRDYKQRSCVNPSRLLVVIITTVHGRPICVLSEYVLQVGCAQPLVRVHQPSRQRINIYDSSMRVNGHICRKY
jgi:hypothetical protein